MLQPGFYLDDYQGLVNERLRRMAAEHFHERFWRKDPDLWAGDGRDRDKIRNSLGWLTVPEQMKAQGDRLSAFAADIRRAGYRVAVHVGMGGSSLAPLVFSGFFPPREPLEEVTVLDTTHPVTIRGLGERLPVEKTLFIIASKSGTTAEVAALGDYFYEHVKRVKGSHAGENFVAITDPGTPLRELAQKRSFRQTFVNPPDIGGRFSALSYFGLVPAALLNLNIPTLLSGAGEMGQACLLPPADNPGLALGAVLGELGSHGVDKVTFLMPDSLALLGMWLEQLIAESTGKEGRGLLPVTGEPAGSPAVYGNDRLFVYFRRTGEEAAALEKLVTALRDGGRPLVVIELNDPLDLGREFFRWEVATAAAGAVLGINPFDQPNVQESKENTNRLLETYQAEGRLPGDRPGAGHDGLLVYSRHAAPSVQETLEAFFAGCRSGDYLGLQAYLNETKATTEKLQSIRRKIRDNLFIATTFGYGPRYLHSTGQYHKGGPNTGIFMQITAQSSVDEVIPGKAYTFGVLNQAQAAGDFHALEKHGRRIIRLHLQEVGAGLEYLGGALDSLWRRGER